MPSTPPPDRSRRLTFGIVAPFDEAATLAALDAFCAALGRLSGIPIARHRAVSPTALADAVAQDRVHLAWMSPTLLALAERVAGVAPLVSAVRQGAARFHAALYVPEVSPVRDVAQLIGTRAAWVAPTSAAGYLLPRMSLARRGFDVARVFASEAFYDSHVNVARAVFDGRADVGACYAVYAGGDPRRPLLRAGYQEGGRAPAVRVIDVAGPIPADVIVAGPGVPPALHPTLTSALLRMAGDPAGAAASRALVGADEFAAFQPGTWDELHALVRAARTLGVLRD